MVNLIISHTECKNTLLANGLIDEDKPEQSDSEMDDLSIMESERLPKPQIPNMAIKMKNLQGL